MKSSTSRVTLGLLVLAIMILGTQPTKSEISIVPMDRLGYDELNDGDSLGLDIDSVYAGNHDGMLMLSVVFASAGEFGLLINVTMRNNNGDLFLAMVSDFGLDSIFLTGATSLEDDAKDVVPPLLEYSEDWRVVVDGLTLSFLLDWVDLGGHDDLDLVFWTGRPADGPDRFPDIGHVTFNTVVSSDAVGAFDPSKPDLDFTDTLEHTSEDGGTTTTQIVTTDENGETTTIGLPTDTDIEDSKNDADNGTITPTPDQETPEVAEEVSLTDLVPFSTTYFVGIVVILTFIRRNNHE